MQRIRIVGRRVHGRWGQATLWRCFELWAAAVDQAAEEHRASALQVRRMGMVSEKALLQDTALTAEAFVEWRQHATLMRRMRVVGTKVMRRWLQTGMWRALSAWKQHAASLRRMKEVGGKVMRRWMQSVMWCCFAQ